ncbi:MAG: transporter substrate-binding domain-containing protein [Caldithrix sp.]|nr:transporter substrate-binding domain-containing protein [Caldithrix sp.]
MRQPKGFAIIGFFVLILVIVAIIIFLNVKQDRNELQTMIQLKYGSGRLPLEAPVHVAKSKAYFQQEGLNLDLKIYPDGKSALQALLDGEVEMATIMATPVVLQSFTRTDFTIVAVLDHNKFHSMIARKSSGITRPEELQGKTIGVTRGTSGEFFMYSFLISHNLLPDELHPIYMKGPALVEAIAAGKIDAMFSWVPYIPEAKRKLGSDGVIFKSEKLVHPSWLFVTSQSFAEHNQSTMIAFLTAVQKGISFVKQNPDEALRLHSRVANVDPEIIRQRFINMHFNLSLRQSLLIELERQARWLIDRDYVEQTDLPNFLDIIHADALSALKPNSVTIIR